ncbi:Site-specific recombinase XerD [Enterococcus malodoratus]|uniref:site-specific integrase n=1 Tax=Enterococcus malodoratus TaxID=71451 RepID=UPI0008D0F893|nr:site-specific integrase [Enterococcus malodoratus]SEU01660.1 Site-specific recombinase XerD [Enterococcus malodoratus]
MANIKKYTKKDGSTAYMFNAYLGVDPLTGKPKRTTRRGFKKPKDAKLALAQLQLEVESQGFVKQDYSTFKAVYELWFVQYKNTVKRTSARRIEYYFDQQILPEFGHLKLDKITATYCQKIVNNWSDRHKSYKAIKRYASKIFSFAIQQQLLKDNPMDRVITPKIQRKLKAKDDQNFLDKTQLKKFLSEIKEHESEQIYAMFHVLAYTGVRRGELLALTWEDIDFSNEKLSVTKNATYVENEKFISTTKTTASERSLSIDHDTIILLKNWKFNQKKSLFSRGIRIASDERQLVFPNPKNELFYKSVLQSILAKPFYKDFKITTHGFRHTHASLLFESGATIKQVQERLGHTNVKTTLDIYTHVTKNAEKDTATNFLKYMNS